MMEWLLSIDPKAVTLMEFVASTMLAVSSFVVGLVALEFHLPQQHGVGSDHYDQEPVLRGAE